MTGGPPHVPVAWEDLRHEPGGVAPALCIPAEVVAGYHAVVGRPMGPGLVDARNVPVPWPLVFSVVAGVTRRAPRAVVLLALRSETLEVHHAVCAGELFQVRWHFTAEDAVDDTRGSAGMTRVLQRPDGTLLGTSHSRLVVARRAHPWWAARLAAAGPSPP